MISYIVIGILALVLVYTLVLIAIDSNRPNANEITYEHTHHAFKAGKQFLIEKLEENDEIQAGTLIITYKDITPSKQHTYDIDISGHYVLNNFVDQYGRSRVRDKWSLGVEYIGKDNGKWDIEVKPKNWELNYF